MISLLDLVVTALLLLLSPAVVPGQAAQSGDASPKVLFLTNSERGQANILLATSHALLVDHHDELQIHFASFPELTDAVAKVSRQAIRNISNAEGITFHAIEGTTYKESITLKNITTEYLVRHPPGLAGMAGFNWVLERILVPWTGPDFIKVGSSIRQIILDVDPTLIVIDGFFPPAADAVRALNRSYLFLSPNSLKDILAPNQPMAKSLWRYPGLGTGYPYPVPWYLIPTNVFWNLRLAWIVSRGKDIRALASYLNSVGFKPDMDFFSPGPKHIPWLAASSAEIEYPMVVANNVVLCGPIYMALDTVEDQDADLAAWLAQAPTVMVILGTHAIYSERDAIEMIHAIKVILDGDGDVQVLWKFKARKDGSSILLHELSSILSTGRVRIEPWLEADPASILESGHVICYVHHGGANSFLESIGTGTPQVLLPMWVDTYDFAVRAEWLGVGVWGNRKSAPYSEGEEVGQSVLKLLSNQAEYKKKAKALATPSKAQSGRFVAARKIVQLVKEEKEALKKGDKDQILIDVGITRSDEL